MLKKVSILLLSSMSLFAIENKNCTCSTQDVSMQTKIIIGACGVGAVVAAPYIVPGSVVTVVGPALAVAKTAVMAATAKIGAVVIPPTLAGQVGLGITAAQLARPFLVQTTQEKLDALLKEEAASPARAKKEFISCLKAHKNSQQRNKSGRPDVCEDAALFYAFNSSMSELQRRTAAFNDGTCFCG